MEQAPFQTVESGHRAVFFFRIKGRQHITNHFDMPHIPIFKIGFHLLTGHLVIMNGVFHLYRQRLIDNVGPVDSTVIHINLDLLTKQLLTFIPKNRVNIHSHARIF